MSLQTNYGDAALRFSDEEIRALCRYLTDDKFIAQYCGIEVQRVSDVRAGMRDRRNSHAGHLLGTVKINSLARVDPTIDANSAARQATDTLHRRIWSMYERVASERGLEHPLVAAVHLGMAA